MAVKSRHDETEEPISDLLVVRKGVGLMDIR